MFSLFCYANDSIIQLLMSTLDCYCNTSYLTAVPAYDCMHAAVKINYIIVFIGYIRSLDTDRVFKDWQYKFIKLSEEHNIYFLFIITVKLQQKKIIHRSYNTLINYYILEGSVSISTCNEHNYELYSNFEEFTWL